MYTLWPLDIQNDAPCIDFSSVGVSEKGEALFEDNHLWN